MLLNTDTVLLSDVHLGSDVSRAESLLKTLQSMRFRRLILLGDILDDLNLKRLTSAHWDFLSHLRKLAKPGRKVEVVWIKGNHDERFFELISCLLGVEAREEYEFEIRGKRCLAIHGHQFDRFIADNPLITRFGVRLYNAFHKVDTRDYKISRFLKRTSKGWLRMTRKVAEGAVRHARQRGVDAIFCGHTHFPMELRCDGVAYYNTGCWTDNPAGIILASDADGVRRYQVDSDANEAVLIPAASGYFELEEERGEFDLREAIEAPALTA